MSPEARGSATKDQADHNDVVSRSGHGDALQVPESSGKVRRGAGAYWNFSSSSRSSSMELKRFALSTDIARITIPDNPAGSDVLISCGGRA